MNKLFSPHLFSALLNFVFFCLALFASFVAPLAHSQPTNAQARQEVATEQALLNDVMSKLSNVKAAKSEFTETRYLKLLVAPIQSSGVLTYTAPDKFEKLTLKPVEEKMTIAKHLVTLEEPAKGRKNTITPNSFPALSALIDAMRGALSGNATLLAETFKVKIDGSSSQWKLTLIPKEAVQFGYIHKITVSGKQDAIDSMEVLQADGDRSVLSMKRAAL
jgi:Outer membrane lipoprotein carrier protein LolA-like